MVTAPETRVTTNAREHVRHSLALRVRYDDRATYLGDWTENLSAGGLFVRTELPLNVGSTVRLELSFPGLLAAIGVEGTIAWRRPTAPGRPAGVGVRVDDPTSRDQLAQLAMWAAAEVPTASGDCLRVLVVDDNPLAARFYERALTRLSERSRNVLEVATTLNGHQALQHMEQHPVDLLITDLYMPVLDGLSLIKKVRQNETFARVPILVITSGGDDERELCAFAGVDAYLEKPVQIGQLLSTIVCLQRARAASQSAT